MIEGSGAGFGAGSVLLTNGFRSIPLTNGSESESRMLKNIRILQIRIQHRKKTTDVLMHITAEKDNSKRTPRHVPVVGIISILSQLALAVLLHREKKD
jgi:hypothetical protein